MSPPFCPRNASFRLRAKTLRNQRADRLEKKRFHEDRASTFVVLSRNARVKITITTTTRKGPNSSSVETITRTDSSGGSSSFDGNVSRQGSKYSRSGDISRSSNGKAGIELTARSNYSIGSTQYWTITGDKKGVKYRF